MKQFFTKYKKVISAISAVLVLVLVAGLMLNMTGKLDNTKQALGIMKVNPLNLVDVDDYEQYDDTTVNGVDITVNADGSITLDGRTTAVTILNLTDGMEAGAETGSYIKDHRFYTMECKTDSVKHDNIPVRVYAEYDESNLTERYTINSETYFVFKTQSDSNYQDLITFSLVLPIDTTYDNVTIYPVINEGIAPVSFYIG